jgi:hypothetical protein
VVPILSQLNLLHTTSQFPAFHSDQILPFTAPSSKYTLFFVPPHQNLLQFSLLSHACHTHRPPHPPWLDLPKYIWGSVQIMKLLIVQLPPFSHYLITLRSKYFSQNPVLKRPQSTLFPLCARQSFISFELKICTKKQKDIRVLKAWEIKFKTVHGRTAIWSSLYYREINIFGTGHESSRNEIIIMWTKLGRSYSKH